MPYAIVVALLVIPLGTIPAGFGMAWYGAVVCLVFCAMAAVGIVRLIGKPLDEPDTTVTAENPKETPAVGHQIDISE
jgi:hypothetical protein